MLKIPPFPPELESLADPVLQQYFPHFLLKNYLFESYACCVLLYDIEIPSTPPVPTKSNQVNFIAMTNFIRRYVIIKTDILQS